MMVYSSGLGVSRYLRKSCTLRFVRVYLSKIYTMDFSTASPVYSTYQEAVATLNSLQSNAAVLEKSRLERDKNAPLNVPQTVEYLKRAGVSVEELERAVPFIHVAGTKGKGSTCAFAESILRHHGLRTGFYSSPHLVEVRERIQIDGLPLSREKFSEYFWKVYHSLAKHKADDQDMPSYFKFLTVMAFYVFLGEKVDVAVVEVGIGGLYDCTNIIKHPAVVGIASLGLDHTSILGHTVEKIAVHKAGIMKTGVPAFTVADQVDSALQVLVEKSREVQCPLYVAPDLDSYSVPDGQLRLGLSGKVQRKNASLALQLSRTFLEGRQGNSSFTPGSPFRLTSAYLKGLENTRWPGRSQIIPGVHNNIDFYVDGAHTAESIQECVQWFQEESKLKKDDKRILLFNVTGDRSPKTLMEPLIQLGFDVVIFCPNIIDANSSKQDQMNLMVTREQQVARCQSNRDQWYELQKLGNQEILVLPSIGRALESIKAISLGNPDNRLNVLVTGSLHLVGGFLSLVTNPQYQRQLNSANN